MHPIYLDVHRRARAAHENAAPVFVFVCVRAHSCVSADTPQPQMCSALLLFNTRLGEEPSGIVWLHRCKRENRVVAAVAVVVVVVFVVFVIIVVVGQQNAKVISWTLPTSSFILHHMIIF